MYIRRFIYRKYNSILHYYTHVSRYNKSYDTRSLILLEQEFALVNERLILTQGNELSLPQNIIVYYDVLYVGLGRTNIQSVRKW